MLIAPSMTMVAPPVYAAMPSQTMTRQPSQPVMMGGHHIMGQPMTVMGGQTMMAGGGCTYGAPPVYGQPMSMTMAQGAGMSQNAFDAADVNHDGKLSRAEFQAAFSH